MKNVQFDTPNNWIVTDNISEDISVCSMQSIQVDCKEDEYIDSISIRYYDGDPGYGVHENMRRALNEYVNDTFPEYYSMISDDQWLYVTEVLGSEAYYYIDQKVNDPAATIAIGVELSLGKEIYIDIRIKTVLVDIDEILESVAGRIHLV